MQLSPDALTILVGLLNDMSLMQRKVAAGQGATCEVNVWEGQGAFYVSLAATIDSGVKVGPRDGHDIGAPFALRITQEMIEAGARALMQHVSGECDLSQGVAEGRAEDVLRAALGLLDRES